MSTMGSGPSFTVGIEEEYKIVDLETRDLVRDLPEGMMERIGEAAGGQVGPEFMRSQVEVATPVCATIGEVRASLGALRAAVANEANRHGLAPISASTHPSAAWTDQLNTDKERYNALAEAMGGVARRLLISGMHVHVGVEDEELRIDLMNQVSYFMPHLLAISTSSPFWHGIVTGLKSYRTSVFRALPRTGLPDEFASWSDYRRHVGVLVEARGHRGRHPAVVGPAPVRPLPHLGAACHRHLHQHRRRHHGGGDVPVPAADALPATQGQPALADLLPDAAQREHVAGAAVRNVRGVDRLRPGRHRAVRGAVRGDPRAGVPRTPRRSVPPPSWSTAAPSWPRGTSADRQLSVYESALDGGASPEEALRQVVDSLVEETISGV